MIHEDLIDAYLSKSSVGKSLKKSYMKTSLLRQERLLELRIPNGRRKRLRSRLLSKPRRR